MSEAEKTRDLLLVELISEENSTRECLERIPMNVTEFNPELKSMPLGRLTLLVADMPRWIHLMIQTGEIDFSTYEHFQPSSHADLMDHYDRNLILAKNSLKKITGEKLSESFYLKHKDVVLHKSKICAMLKETLTHWIEHRSQLTLYMRLNDIPVPAIQGMSLDEPRDTLNQGL